MAKTRNGIFLILLTITLWAFHFSVLCADEKADPATAPLSALRFISGVWQGELAGGQIEEIWSTPNGDNMMGMFRLLNAEKSVFYEFMVIEQSSTGPVLRIKHFHPGLRGWEEKDEVHNFPLGELWPHKAVFENKTLDKKLIYERSQTDSLFVTLDEPADGQRKTTTFRFKKISGGH